MNEIDAASWQWDTTGKGVETCKGYLGCRWVRRDLFDIRPTDGSADRAAVLKHVTAQTGPTAKTEKRTVWVLSVKQVAQ